MYYTGSERYRMLELYRDGKITSSRKDKWVSEYVRNFDGVGLMKSIITQDIPEWMKIVDIVYMRASVFIRDKYDDHVNIRAPYSPHDVLPYWDYADAVLRGDDQLILDICDPSCNRPITPSKYDYIRRTSVYGAFPYWERPRFDTPDTEYCHITLNCSTNEHRVEWKSYIYWWAPDAIGERRRRDGIYEFEYRK